MSLCGESTEYCLGIFYGGFTKKPKQMICGLHLQIDKLGRINTIQAINDECEMNKAAKQNIKFIKAREYTAKDF
ncbi:hypothetical protein GCM10009007_01930 [Formosimonas limnophila]|uniref:Uncharacterized protein n=1 Tax=Formosimonas limnophila TaxID=1384487 RepID=A0A8J3FZ31_9BURK|nr:hypothetical protein GCM10009007_01930 [Formosimonas limnophila]